MRNLSRRERFGVFALVVVAALSFALQAAATGPTVSAGAFKCYSNTSPPIKSGDTGYWCNGNQPNFRKSDGSDIAIGAGGGSGVAQSRHAVADANYTTATTDTVVAYTSITAARTVTFTVSAGTASVPFYLAITDESGSASATNTITIAGSSGNVDGVASKVVVNGSHGWWYGYSNGTNIFTVATSNSSSFYTTTATSAVPPTISWTAPTLLNSWTNLGAPYDNVGYYKDAIGWVHIRGLVHNGSSITATVFTFPAGYRPLNTKFLPSYSNGVFSVVQIDSSGNVSCANLASNSTASFSLDMASFPAEQ